MAAALQLRFIAFTVDVIDRRGPIIKMCRHLKPRKAKIRLY